MSSIPTPTADSIASVRATVERLESHVEPRAECCICGLEYRDGPEPTSHAYCGEQCERLATEPVYEATLLKLADDMMMAWGRYVGSRHGSGEWIAGQIAHSRSRKRFNHALKELVGRMKADVRDAEEAVEDMERGK